MNFKDTMAYLAVALIIEYGVCLVISFILNDRDEYWNALLIMLVLWGLQFALWIKNLVVGTIAFHLYTKKKLSSLIEEKMIAARLPYLGDADADHIDYLRTLLNDPEVTRDEFRFAAESAGILDFAKSQSMVQGLRLGKVYDLALKSYLRKRVAWEMKRQPEFT